MYRLTIFKEGQRVADHELPRPVTSLGRHTDNDVVLDDLALSRFHARLEQRGARHVVVDLGSQNGTYVNGNRVAGELELKAGDRVGLGRYVAIYDLDPEEKRAARMNAQEPHETGEGPSLLLLQHGQEMERFPLTGEGYIIGRSQRCDIVIGLLGLSRRHARVYPEPEGWMLEDLGSQNGTILNDQRIAGPTLLRAGDTINFFEYQVVYQDPPPKGAPADPYPAEPLSAPRGPGTLPEMMLSPRSSTLNTTLEQVPMDLDDDDDGDPDGFDQNSTEMDEPVAPSRSVSAPQMASLESTLEGPVSLGWPSDAEAEAALGASMQLAPAGFLEVRVDNRLLTEVPLDRVALRIGSDARCDVALPPLTSISGWHLVVVRMGATVLLQKVGEAAAPRVDGVPMNQAYLREGDRVQLGRVTLVYRRH